NLGHAAAFDFQDSVATAIENKALSSLRNKAQPSQHKSRERFVAGPPRQNDIALASQIAQAYGGVYHQNVFPDLADSGFLTVILVLNLAYDLFQHVLNRHQAYKGSELIHD